MVFFNHATRQMTVKIVYYGPGLCGKTTNLNTIYGKTSQKARGEMVSLNTETDRTLFFDLLPLDVGTIGGFKTKLQLYTVPGQVFYNSTRKLVLKGVDGIVFVADSQTPMLDANKESFQNLGDNLKELGLELESIPLVFQWNKRDLRQIIPVEQLEAELNPRQSPSYHAIASEGSGVFETLRGITKLALAQIKIQHLGDLADGRGREPSGTPAAPSVARLNGSVSATSSALASPPISLAVPRLAMPQVTTSPTPKFGREIALPTLPKAAAPAPRPLAKLPSLLPMPAPQVDGLRVPLVEGLDDSELEIRVQVLQGGRVVGEVSVKKPAPAQGVTSRIPLVLKRG
ncbi:MAG: mutual gliding protein [Holophagaceae bacterium]|nr:mutual gliding protein [Holophagaceae bacterium]